MNNRDTEKNVSKQPPMNADEHRYGRKGRSALKDGSGSCRSSSAYRALAVLALLCLALPAFATRYAGDFEELGVSARAIGMGGAMSAQARGPAAIYYNPALAARSRARTSALLFHSEDFAGLVNHNFLGLVFGSGLQSFGVAVLHNGIPGIKLTTLPDTTLPPGENNRPIVKEIVSANQLVAYLNYSRIISPFLSLGGNAKLVHQSLGPGSCFGMGLDLGLVATPATDLDVALRVRNVSTSPLFWSTGTRETIMPRPCLGLSKTFRFGRDALALAADVEAALEESSLYHNFGIEYSFRDALFGRIGAHRSNFTFGLGARYRRLYLDYGYTGGYAPGSRELGSAQQLSGGVEF